MLLAIINAFHLDGTNPSCYVPSAPKEESVQEYQEQDLCVMKKAKSTKAKKAFVNVIFIAICIMFYRY